MSDLVFLDLETTGTDPRFHDLYEAAFVWFDEEKNEWRDREYWLDPDTLVNADPTALRIGGYYDRRPWSAYDKKIRRVRFEGDAPDKTMSVSRGEAAEQIAGLLSGKHLAGMVVSFDAEFLQKFLRQHLQAPSWHYHVVDVEAIAAGALGWEPPWNSTKLSEGLGIERPKDTMHTALGDALWARDVYGAARHRVEEIRTATAELVRHARQAAEYGVKGRPYSPGGINKAVELVRQAHGWD